jgi:two-component system nitrogen regulation response regulator GlnG
MTIEHARTVLVADDDPTMRLVLERALSPAGFRTICCASPSELLGHLMRSGADLVITDIVMPGGSGLDLLQRIKASHPSLPVIVMTAQSTLHHAVQSFEHGAFEYLAKPFDIHHLVALVKSVLESPERGGQPAGVPDPGQEQPGSGSVHEERTDRYAAGIIGSSRAMQELFRTIGRLANSEMTVLVHGESGTGKELVARAVHRHSPRRSGPFVAINMAALPRNLIESELFGHEKGAFTGAVLRRVGHFERARGGTLFLDEIGDMPIEAQTRLLRVLQDGTYTQVGGTQTMRSDVRIVAATHQDLSRAIVEGRFREDLFHRLNVIPLHVPPLRARREDIPLLAEHFLREAARALALPVKGISPACLGHLMAYEWPGNIRELENVMQRLSVLVPDDIIDVDMGSIRTAYRPESGTGMEMERGGVVGSVTPALSGAPAAPGIPVTPEQVPVCCGVSTLERDMARQMDVYFGPEPHQATVAGVLYDTVIQQVERPLIARVLQETAGNQLQAARILGINRNTLRKKIHELGVQWKK